MFDDYLEIGKLFPSGKSMFLKWPFANDNKWKLKPVVSTQTLVSSLRIKDRFYYLWKLTDLLLSYGIYRDHFLILFAQQSLSLLRATAPYFHLKSTLHSQPMHFRFNWQELQTTRLESDFCQASYSQIPLNYSDYSWTITWPKQANENLLWPFHSLSWEKETLLCAGSC